MTATSFANTSMLHIPIDEQLKVPTAQTQAAMHEADEIFAKGKFRFTTAEELFAELDKAVVDSTI